MKNLSKRLCLGTLLGIIFGILCFLGFMNNPDPSLASYQTRSLTNVFMRSIIINRMILGILIAFAGVMTRHPWFKFKIHPAVRGIKVGILISLALAINVFLTPKSDYMSHQTVFFMILGAGALIGLIIDVIVTKLYGEGKALLKK